jgi:putative dimethyl sulfoxide reductase chaperone
MRLVVDRRRFMYASDIMQDTNSTEEVEPDRPGGLAGALALFCELFWGPSPEICATLFDPGLDPLSRSTAEWPNLASGLSALAEVCSSIEDRSAFCGDLESAYVALFVNARGGVPAPPYASCHIEGDAFMGEAASRMRRRLDEAGLATEAPGEPPDHLAFQLEFLYYLLLERGHAPAAAFAREEMLPWVGRLSNAVATAEDGSPELRFWSLACVCVVRLLETIGALRS